MMFFIFLLVISFIMEGLFSTIVPMDSLFCPLFTIVCLISFFPHRVWNHMFLIFLSLTGYRVIGFLLLVITGVISFSATRLIDSIVSSLIVNLIYCIFLYGILEILRKQKKITLQR